MKRTNFIVVVLTAELFVASLLHGQGALQVSNLGNTPYDSQAAGSDSWIAQTFFIVGSDPNTYQLNSVQLLMNPASGNPAGFTVSLYKDDAFVPTTHLGDLTGTDPAAGGIVTFAAASDMTVSSGSEYSIVITSGTPIAQGACYWSATTGGNTRMGEWTIDDIYFTSADGSNWTDHFREDIFQMAIYATAVPEPTGLCLLLLGGSLFGFRRFCTKAGLQ